MLDPNKESRLNFQKVYSFTIKWILKEKPLYLTIGNDSSENNQRKKIISVAEQINEYWMLSWMMQSYQAHTGKKLDISPSEAESLRYNFKYRDFSPSMLELFLDQKIDHAIFQQL